MPLPPDEPNKEERLEELPEDSQTPFSADSTASDASAGQSQLDDTHPATDTNLEEEEIYEEGVSGAAEAEEPNGGNVAGYENPEDSAESDKKPPAQIP